MAAAASAASSASSSSSSVLCNSIGNVAIVVLNREKALNALDCDMVNQIKSNLITWRSSSSSSSSSRVGAFIMKGAGSKAFCAGGDVKSIYMYLKDASSSIGSGKPGTIEADFFRSEYEMNYLIGTSPIPQISIWDGIVMGGGVGVSVLGEYRVATARTLFAMPETAIGLFPDVGSSAWLPHLPDGQGLYIGLTGCRLGAADLVYTGIATHYIPSYDIEVVEKVIIENCTDDPKKSRDIISNILRDASNKPDDSKASIEVNKEAIKRCFSNSTSIEEIMVLLQEETRNKHFEKWANTTMQTLSRMSPTSLKLTLAQLSAGKDLDLKGCLMLEYRLMMGCMRGSDFREGIRALLIDKDNNPKWSPSLLSEVNDADIQKYFSLEKHNLDLSRYL
jgi:enoyl-CoA hydratase/carnithine racemase